MRQKVEDEQERRDVVIQVINDCMITSHLVYPPPFEIVRQLAEKNIHVSWAYVYRRYIDMGIENKRGLWVRKI